MTDVKKIATSIWYKYKGIVPLSDLISAGHEGALLFDRCKDDKYDKNETSYFRYLKIKGAVIDEIRRNRWFRGCRKVHVSQYREGAHRCHESDLHAKLYLHEVAGRLEPEQRLIVNLVHVVDMPKFEIARLLGVSPSRLSQKLDEAYSLMRKGVVKCKK